MEAALRVVYNSRQWATANAAVTRDFEVRTFTAAPLRDRSQLVMPDPWLLLALWCPLAWGVWPFLRTKCGAHVPLFALLNMSAQVFGATLSGLTVGEQQHRPFTCDLSNLLTIGPSIRDCAVFFGGFCLGHGDHISAVAMQHLPSGVVNTIYAGSIVAGGGMLNYLQVQPSSPPLLFMGFALVFCAITALALAEHSHHHSKRIHTREAESGQVYHAFERGGAADATTPTVSMAFERSASPSGEARLSFRSALAVTLAGAACSCLWSPLATYGTLQDAHNPQSNSFVCQLTFALGQLAALPSVAFISGSISGNDARTLYSQVSCRSVGWGLLCGLAISSGFVAFFMSSAHVSATVTFGIAHCSPLVSLLIETCLTESFANATSRVVGLLTLCVGLYGVAIVALMMST